MSYDPTDTLDRPGPCQCGAATVFFDGVFLCVTSADRSLACLARHPELRKTGRRVRPGGNNAAVMRLVAAVRRAHREYARAVEGAS